ncbi:hypothetical protein ACHAXR_003091 [Thalassiosira sp. AJA248-18]
MNRLSALTLLIAAASSTAFVVPSSIGRVTRSIAMAEEGTDFDAPIPANPASASGPLESQPVVDDECYMGKEGQLDECADFDPPAKAS